MGSIYGLTSVVIIYMEKSKHFIEDVRKQLKNKTLFFTSALRI